jgi:PD-(D/E)XK endonuclease
MTSKTHQVGTVSQTMVLARLVELGFEVVLPWNDHLGYDLAYIVNHNETHFGFFQHTWTEVVRVQVKTARIASIYDKTQGVRRRSTQVLEFATSGMAEWGRKRHGYHGQAEWFGVYSPDTGKVYMVSINEVGKRQTSMRLRLEGSANNQEKGVHWAKDYEL